MGRGTRTGGQHAGPPREPYSLYLTYMTHGEHDIEEKPKKNQEDT